MNSFSIPHDIKVVPELQLIGSHLPMSYMNNRTAELWRSFMPRRKEVKNVVGTMVYSVQQYSKGFFNNFSPSNTFEKWAAIEVQSYGEIPDGMERLIIPAGLYAVFHYKGSSSEGPKVFQYILGTWLPGSEYVLDDRPHFEILGERYKNDHPDSEEDICIPIKKK